MIPNTTSVSQNPVSWILVATNQGTFIINRHDHAESSTNSYGVGLELLTFGNYNSYQVSLMLQSLSACGSSRGRGIVALDIGANIGVTSVVMARHIMDWGEITCFEPQTFVYYALCGNLILNNCSNARAEHKAVGNYCGKISFRSPDYSSPASFGSLELKGENKDLGQNLSEKKEECEIVTIDSLNLPRLDFMKIDVEGMEMEVLSGAIQSLYRMKPFVFIEHFKSSYSEIRDFLSKFDYHIIEHGSDFLPVPLQEIRFL